MENLLSVKALCKNYQSGTYSNPVLSNVDFELKQGEFAAVMGPSGSGKSTLLYTVSGMDTVTAGTVQFCGKDIAGMKQKELSQLRLNEMGFIFQQMYMMKKLSIFENIILPAYQAGKERSAVNARAEQLCSSLGIRDIAGHAVQAVSGGELQRACLCRALINEPKIIFADEPTGALNSKAAGDVMRELRAANHAGTAVLMVTHSIRIAAHSERVVYLMDGGIQGELHLGRMEDADALPARERTLNAWLLERGW